MNGSLRVDCILAEWNPRSQIKVSYERSEATDEKVRSPTLTESE